MRKTPVGERIAAKCIPGPNGCIEYTGGAANTRSGHRQVWTDDGMRLVHRVAWIIANGPIPDGLCVCHRCDNPPCVNPDHLFLGTQRDNTKDRDDKGRHVALRGTANGSARLTEADVLRIDGMLRDGIAQREIARRIGVRQSTVSLISLGRAWRHVTGRPPSRPGRGVGGGAPKRNQNARRATA